MGYRLEGFTERRIETGDDFGSECLQFQRPAFDHTGNGFNRLYYCKVEYYGIRRVKVENGERSEVEKRLSEAAKRIRDSKEFQAFQVHYDSGVDVFRNSLNDIVEKNAEVDVDQLYDDMQKLIAGGTGLNLFDMIQNLRQYDDSTYTHAINVAMICNILAGWLDFSVEDIKTATMCGLLHDIGKVKIPSEIIKKPGKLRMKNLK